MPPDSPVSATVERPVPFRGLKGGDHIWRIAACRDPDGHVTGTTVRFELACEDLIETIVVGDRSEARGVNGKRQNGEGRAVEGEPSNEFGSDMLGVGSTATIAENENFILAP